ncbi:hypothetical protein LDENG_00164150 [Lucifuga dentata]|nr:hypothetical protein LDENG_00164150 [Lucifuga dentata]
MASSSSRVLDVHFALQRAKRKICSLQQQLSHTEISQEKLHPPTWTPSRELRETLVDMYRANPRVNVELRQRLPSPTGLQLSNSTQQFSNSTQQRSNYNRLKTSFVAEDLEWTQGPQHLHDTPTSPSPLSQRRSLSPPTSPLSQRRSPSPSSSRSPGGAGGMEVDLYPSQGPSPRADTWANGPDRDGSSSAPGSPAVRRHLVNTEDSVHQETTFVPNTSGRVLTLDRDKNICFLLKELDTLRQINNELQLQLVQKEKDLQSRKVQEELRMEQQEVMSWERPAGEDEEEDSETLE